MGGGPLKPGLGRGLGSLMNGAKPGDAPVQAGAPRRTLTRGMATLLRGTNGHAKPSSPDAPTRGIWAAVRLSLMAADLVLLGLSAWLVFGRTGPLRPMELVLCVGAVALGAWLSCLALWKD